MFKNIKINQLYLVYYIKCYKLFRGFYIIEMKEKMLYCRLMFLKKYINCFLLFLKGKYDINK